MKTRTVHIDAICERIDYGFTASADFSIKTPRLLRITDIQNGAVDWNHVPGCQITPEEEADNRLCVGDIVFARTGATTGKCFLIKHVPRAVFASYLIRLRATAEVLPHYLYSFFQSEFYWRQIKSAVRGAAQGGVNSTTLSSLVLPLPDLSEQRRIAERMELADRLRRTRQYALELSNTILPAAFLELFGDPVQNPKGWPVITVEEAGAVQLGRQRAPKYQTGEFRKPYIRVANVYENEIDLSDLLYMDFDASDFATYSLKHGDVLLNEGQSTELVGRPAMWREEITGCCFQNTLLRFQADRKICEPAYSLWLFLRYLHTGEFAKLSAKTSSVAHLGSYRFSQMRFPLPPLALQQKFAVLVERVDRLRAVQQEELRQAEHLFASLLNRAFSD